MIILAPADSWTTVLVVLAALLGVVALAAGARDVWRAGRTPEAYATDETRPAAAGNQD